jgi:hypothetical protein
MAGQKLKSCPFCGGEAEIKTYNLCDGFVSCIRCTKCGYKLLLQKVDIKTESAINAIKVWNKRYEPPAPNGAIVPAGNARLKK